MKLSYNQKLNDYLAAIIAQLQPSGAEVSCSVVALPEGGEPVFISYQPDLQIYPASISKLFIAAEVLRQADIGLISLNQPIEITANNHVGDPRGIVPVKSIVNETTGAVRTVDQLLDSMLAVSSNTAANCLIDLVSRESINKNIIGHFNWKGSEVTRKFLAREKEEPQYRAAPMTMCCSRHVAELLYYVETQQFVSAAVSDYLKQHLGKAETKDKLFLYIPEFQDYHHKIGSVKTTIWTYGARYAMKSILRRNVKNNTWLHDAAIINTGSISFVICLLTRTRSYYHSVFPMKKFSKKLLGLLQTI